LRKEIERRRGRRRRRRRRRRRNVHLGAAPNSY
jgi:hypothetical protein